MNKPIKVLMVITGGIKNDGITNAWLKYIIKINGMPEIQDAVHFDLVAYGNQCDEGQISRYKAQKCEIIRLPDRNKNTKEYIYGLIKSLKAGKYDAIHVNGSSAALAIEMLAAWIAGIKIRISHSRNTSTYNLRAHKLFKPVFNMLCNTRFACGDDAGRWLFGSKNFTVIPNGLDFSKFNFDNKKRDEQRKKLGVEDKFVVGHVGRFNKQKNHKYMIDIFKELSSRLPDAVLYLIGDGRLRKQTEDYVSTLGLKDRVVFTGEINNIPDMLQAMDIMLLPSLYEGLPNVVIEWQSIGLPVILSDTITKQCAVCELVEFLSIKEKPGIWSDRIMQIRIQKRDRLHDSTMAQKALAENGFDINKNALRLVNIYRELVESHS